MGNVSAVERVIIVDGMSPRFATSTDLVASMVDEINAVWRRGGVIGARLVSVEYNDGKALIETAAGDEPLSIEIVRDRILKGRKSGARK